LATNILSSSIANAVGALLGAFGARSRFWKKFSPPVPDRRAEREVALRRVELRCDESLASS
jgi:hypothetical protein